MPRTNNRRESVRRRLDRLEAAFALLDDKATAQAALLAGALKQQAELTATLDNLNRLVNELHPKEVPHDQEGNPGDG